MSKFHVTPTNNSAPFDIEADHAETEPSSGAVLFYDADNQLIAKQLNVSFHKLDDEPVQP